MPAQCGAYVLPLSGLWLYKVVDILLEWVYPSEKYRELQLEKTYHRLPKPVPRQLHEQGGEVTSR